MDNMSRESSFLSQGTMDVLGEVCSSDLDTLLKSEHFYEDTCLQQGSSFNLSLDTEIQDPFPCTIVPDSTFPKTPILIDSCVSTSTYPSMEDYPGTYDFDVEMSKSAGDKAKWEHSTKLNKLFVVMNAKVPLKFKTKEAEVGLYVRVLPVFLAQDSAAEPVKRCPTHISNQEKSNQDFIHVDHVIRCHHQGAIYEKNGESKRLSVIVPTEPPQPGCNWFSVVYSFMCKNSCGLGMNRRSTALIFTLERQTGEVIGRKLINIRICSCPRRDMHKEESDFSKREVEGEGHIVHNIEKKSCEKKLMLKKPLKRLSEESVYLRFPKAYLKALREIISSSLSYRELTDAEERCLQVINDNLHCE